MEVVSMPALSLSRLRTRLALIALLTVVPAVLVIVYTQWAERRLAREQAFTRTLGLARAVAARESNMFTGAQRLLLTLAQFPPLRSADPSLCQDLLPNVFR